MQYPERGFDYSLFLKDMVGMKRSILGILEVIAVVGYSQRRCELRGGGEEEGDIAGAGGDVGWWAQIKRSLARDGFANELF